VSHAPWDPNDESTKKLERPELAVHVVIREVKSGALYEATAARVRVGRNPDCEVPLVVDASEGVSRVHCEFGLDAYGGVVLMDSGSTNGTLLNGHRLSEAVRVSNGQAVALGDQGPTLIIERVALKTLPQS
jgi:pSer/pThr/pTyr-binding forkhead associated (FHA) protein